MRHAFAGPTLCEALGATFRFRGSTIPETIPSLFQVGFDDLKEPQNNWQSFLRKSDINDAPPFPDVLTLLHDFLLPPLQALAHQEPFDLHWPPGGPWQPADATLPA